MSRGSMLEELPGIVEELVGASDTRRFLAGVEDDVDDVV